MYGTGGTKVLGATLGGAGGSALAGGAVAKSQGLPVTGVDILAFVAVGVALVILGLVILRMSLQRRTQP
jgi:hypothetical protein